MNEVYEPGILDDAPHRMSFGAALYARKYWVLIPTLLAFLLALAYVTAEKPRYSAGAKIRLDGPVTDATWIDRQVSLLTSRDLAREVVQKLGLEGDPELDPALKGFGPIQRALILFGLAHDPLQVSPEDRAVDTFSERLTAYSPTETRVLVVDFWAHDPVFAAKVANEVAALYLARQTDTERDLAKDAADALDHRIKVLSEKLARASDDVERYRAASGLPAGANNMAITAQQPADLNTDKVRARTDEANSQAKAALIRQLLRNGRVSESPDVANNDLIRRISAQRVTANAQLALASGTLGPRHPRILELKAEIENLDVQLRQAANDIASALENDAKIAAARGADIQTALDQQKQAAESAKETADKNGIQLRALVQVEANYREQLESAKTKYQDALSRQSGAPLSDARLVAAATAPDQPSFPGKPQVVGLATLAAFVLSLGLVLGRTILGDRSSADATHGDMPLIPVRVAEDEKPPAASASEPLNRLARAGIELPDEEPVGTTAPDEPDENEKVAAQSTPSPGVNIVATRLNKSKEATDALIDFARTLARDGRPVIVDLDSRDSQLARLIGPEPQDGKMSGLTDLLDGNASFADVIHRDAASRLHFVPFGSKDTFNPDDLDLVLDALSRTYDFVILAAPPFPGSPMTKALAPYVDFVVMATAGECDDAAMQTARAELDAAGAPEVLLVGDAKQAA